MLEVENDVIAAAQREHESVRTAPAGQLVIAEPTHEDVVPAVPAQIVIPKTTEQQIVAPVAPQVVITGAAIDIEIIRRRLTGTGHRKVNGCLPSGLAGTGDREGEGRGGTGIPFRLCGRFTFNVELGLQDRIFKGEVLGRECRQRVDGILGGQRPDISQNRDSAVGSLRSEE